MKNTTGIPNLSKKKDQLIMKTALIHILSDSNNRITRVELHNEIEEVPYDDLFDSRLTKKIYRKKNNNNRIIQ